MNSWIKQTDKPCDPHSEIVAIKGCDKYLCYVGPNKILWPLGQSDFKPFRSDEIEYYIIIPPKPKSN